MVEEEEDWSDRRSSDPDDSTDEESASEDSDDEGRTYLMLTWPQVFKTASDLAFLLLMLH